MSNRGFKGFRLPERIEAERLDASLKRMGLDNRYIYWVGEPYRARRQSLRSNALACLTEKRRPVSLSTWIKRAAACVSEDVGYSPERVREGLYLHRNSKPSVFFELERDKDGNYRSVNDCPYAFGFAKGLKKGDVVIAAKEPKQLPAPKGKGKAPAEIEGPKAEELTV